MKVDFAKQTDVQFIWSFQSSEMFVLAAVVPVKVAFDTVSGTMTNAGKLYLTSESETFILYLFWKGSSGPMPNYAPRMQANSFPIQTQQPQKEKYQDLEPTYYLGWGNFSSLSSQIRSTSFQNISDPTNISCPSCSATIKTKVVYEHGSNPPSCLWLYCGSNSIKDAHHYCPKCRAYLGKFEPWLKIIKNCKLSDTFFSKTFLKVDFNLGQKQFF